MRFKATALVVALGVTLSMVGSVAAAEPTHEAVREQLADLLAGDEFEKVDFEVTTFDQAMVLIYRTVDTYLDSAVTELGHLDNAREYGVEVLRGLNDHRVRFSGDDGLDIIGDRKLTITTEDEAAELGELVFRVADLLHEANVGRGVGISSGSREIFESMMPVAGNRQALVTQYVVRMRSLNKIDRKGMIRELRR